LAVQGLGFPADSRRLGLERVCLSCSSVASDRQTMLLPCGIRFPRNAWMDWRARFGREVLFGMQNRTFGPLLGRRSGGHRQFCSRFRDCS
jgi:hypothetical protein